MSARPANAYRLLKEQGQLALVFPEGTKGPSKSYTDRYQLRRFGRGGFVEIAMRAGVRSIPIAVVGSEEAMPVVFRLPAVAKALGVPYFPVTANMLAMGPLGVVMPFPAKFKLRVLDPVHFDVPPDQDRYSKSRDHGGVRDASARISRRPSTTCCATGAASGSADGDGRRILVTGADTFWGGRMVQALETDPSMDVILGMGPTSPSVPFERAEFVRADQNYSILSRIVKATQVDTILHTFMITNSSTVPRPRHARDQRHRHHEPPRRRRRGRSSGPPVVVKSSTLVYGSAASDPNTFAEDTPRTSPVRNSVERALVEAEGLVRDFSEDNPATKVTVLRFANVLGTHLSRPSAATCPARSVPSIFGFDPLLQFVEEDDVVRALVHVTRERHPGPLQRGRRRPAAVERGGRHLRHPAACPSHPGARSRSGRSPGCFDLPPSSRTCCARAGRRHPPLRRDRLQVQRYTSAGAVRELHPGRAAAPAVGSARRRRTPTSTTSSSSSATRRRSWAGAARR